jgi:hypothetical protein
MSSTTAAPKVTIAASTVPKVMYLLKEANQASFTLEEVKAILKANVTESTPETRAAKTAMLVPKDETERCHAATKAGPRCQRKVIEGSKCCASHRGIEVPEDIVYTEAVAKAPKAPKEPKVVVERAMCSATTRAGMPCSRHAREGAAVCGQHTIVETA